MLEATAGYEWFVKLVEPLAGRVLLAHPRKMRIIAESTRKSDKVDARVLAEFLALDMIPPAHRPTPRQRAHRKLVRRRVCVRGADAQNETNAKRLVLRSGDVTNRRTTPRHGRSAFPIARSAG
ncbi:MAG: hypothetical protein IPM64_11020 [Phycisphaerales bacterium]|nr:hypothetical protein [Phycisphaerales bacterium]